MGVGVVYGAGVVAEVYGGWDHSPSMGFVLDASTALAKLILFSFIAT